MQKAGHKGRKHQIKGVGARSNEEEEKEKADLMDHLMLEDCSLGEDLHGDAFSGLGVDGEFDLGEGALPDGPADIVLADLSGPHLSPCVYYRSTLIGDIPGPVLAGQQRTEAPARISSPFFFPFLPKKRNKRINDLPKPKQETEQENERISLNQNQV